MSIANSVIFYVKYTLSIANSAIIMLAKSNFLDKSSISDQHGM